MNTMTLEKRLERAQRKLSWWLKELTLDIMAKYPFLVVDNIVPSYYAFSRYDEELEFDLIGHNFDEIPYNAVGVLSTDNENPLMHQKDATNYATIVQMSGRKLSMMTEPITSGSVANKPIYLGAIVSADRNIVYWVNNTSPIP